MEEQKKLEEMFEVEYMSRWSLMVRAFRRHRLGMISLWILLALYLMALFADFLSPYNPYEQRLTYSFMNPTKIRWRYDGKFVGPYVYPMVSYRDPTTFQKYYIEASKIDRIDVITKNGERKRYELGKDGVTGIVPVFKILEKVYGDGKEITVKRRTKEMELVPLEDSVILKEGVKHEKSSNPDLINIYVKNPMYARKLKSLEKIEGVVFEKRLDALLILRGDDVEYLENFKVVHHEFKRYPIRFFVRSWKYKLLWLIPTDIHLFGVEEPATIYIFGADKFGRDIFTRTLFGSRISLSIGFVGILITFTLGLLLGGIAGYYGKWVDEALMRTTEVLMSIPSFYLLISLRAILPMDLPSTTTYFMLVVILSFLGWPGMSRVIRGMVLSLKQTEFVEAARALGFPSRRIIWRHILPNTATYVIIAATLSIPGYILGEAGLSFLGLGIREPQSSWGLMLAQAQDITVLKHYPWLLIPGVFLFIAVLAFNLFGDAVRDAFDPRSMGH